MSQGMASVSLVAAASATLWLGLLTSISPCPLATNVVEIGEQMGRTSGG